jgi:hypothetical protein
MLLQEETIHPNVLIAPRDKWTARFQSLVAAEALKEGGVAVSPSGVVKFSDPGDRIRWGLAFARAFFQRKWKTHGFLALPGEADETGKDELRLALFSDWGTGLYGAPRIKAAIEGDGQGFDYIVHLGDTYYTGEEDEVERYLLGDWPKVVGAVNRALNGNHEMYSGGNGYFRVALPWLGQSSSVFAVQNDHWLIVGLDSAYVDWDLGNDQDKWLADLVGKVVDRVWPDATRAQEIKLELFKAEQAGALQELTNAWDNAKAQLAVNQVEAGSSSIFVAGSFSG